MEEKDRKKYLLESNSRPGEFHSGWFPDKRSPEERAASWAELLPLMTFEQHPGGWILMRIAPDTRDDESHTMLG